MLDACLSQNVLSETVLGKHAKLHKYKAPAAGTEPSFPGLFPELGHQGRHARASRALANALLREDWPRAIPIPQLAEESEGDPAPLCLSSEGLKAKGTT